MRDVLDDIHEREEHEDVFNLDHLMSPSPVSLPLEGVTGSSALTDVTCSSWFFGLKLVVCVPVKTFQSESRTDVSLRLISSDRNMLPLISVQLHPD